MDRDSTFIKRINYWRTKVISKVGENVLVKKDENLEIGKIYGDLKIVSFICRQSGCLKYLAECQTCGRKKEVWIKHVKNGIGDTHKNCITEIPKDNNTKRLRNIWSHMVDRCTNPNSEHYNCYGGRGITTQYKFFIDFYDDFYESYINHVQIYGEKNTTIDRINPDGNYVKENMRWATWDIQKVNKRWCTYEAKKDNEIHIGTAKELSKIIGCNQGEISSVAKERRGATTVYGYTIRKLPQNKTKGDK